MDGILGGNNGSGLLLGSASGITGVGIESLEDSHMEVGNNNIEIDDSNFIPLKILVSNHTAGGIIGREGSTLSDYEHKYNCKIVVSRYKDVFPGTEDRICLIKGELENLKTAISLLLTKFAFLDNSENNSSYSDENQSQGMNQDELRILIPVSACGFLIGKAGHQIKSIASASQTEVKIQNKEELHSIITAERILTVKGEKDNIIHCLGIILDRIEQERQTELSEARAEGLIDDDKNSYDNLTWKYDNESPSSSIDVLMRMSQSEKYQEELKNSNNVSPLEVESYTINLTVENSLVGNIIGSGGSTLKFIQENSHTKIQISPSHDRDRSSHNTRKIQIIGPNRVSCDTAHYWLLQKMSAEIDAYNNPNKKRRK